MFSRRGRFSCSGQGRGCMTDGEAFQLMAGLADRVPEKVIQDIRETGLRDDMEWAVLCVHDMMHGGGGLHGHERGDIGGS